MRFEKIKYADSKDFDNAWHIYESSFPLDERRSLDSQIQVFKRKDYHFFAAIEDKNLVGILTYWIFKDFLFADHLAVKEEFRRKGIGKKIMQWLIIQSNKRIILEVELPETTEAKNRIKFYEKLGFKLNKNEYMQPSYGKGKKPVPMLLMTYPEKIDEKEFKKARKEIYEKVYGVK